MVRECCQSSIFTLLCTIFLMVGKGKTKNLRTLHGILLVCLVEISTAEKKQGIGMLALDIMEMLHLIRPHANNNCGWLRDFLFLSHINIQTMYLTTA